MSVMQKNKRGGLRDYFLSRGSTFAFLFFLVMGLTLSSSYCAGSTEQGVLLRSIVTNQLTLQQQQNFIELLFSSIYGFIGILIFLYICVNCRKGSLLVYCVPLLHGASLGATIATVLFVHGFGALSYILLCIFVPKALQTMLLLSACNKTARYCKTQYGGSTTRKGEEAFPVLLYLLLFAVYFVVEALFVYLFRTLL